MLRCARDSLAISVTMAARILAVALATVLLHCVTSVHANDVSTATHKVTACAIVMLQVRCSCMHCIFPCRGAGQPHPFMQYMEKAFDPSKLLENIIALSAYKHRDIMVPFSLTGCKVQQQGLHILHNDAYREEIDRGCIPTLSRQHSSDDVSRAVLFLGPTKHDTCDVQHTTSTT
jgi:hypothetical protein